MTPNELIRNLPDTELRLCAAEALAWRRKGVLSGEALRGVARRLIVETQVDDFDATRMADNLVIEEAVVRFVAQA